MDLPLRSLAAALVTLGLIGCSTPKPLPPPEAPHVALSPVAWKQRAAPSTDDVAQQVVARLDQGAKLFESLRGAAQSMTSAAWFDPAASMNTTDARIGGRNFWVHLELSAIDATRLPATDVSGWGSFGWWITTGPFSYLYNDVGIDNLRLTAELFAVREGQTKPLATIVIDSSDCATDFVDRHLSSSGWLRSVGAVVASIVMPPSCVRNVVDPAPLHPADVIVDQMVEQAAERLAAAVERAVNGTAGSTRG